MKRYVCEWERMLFSCSVIGMPSAVSWGNVIRSQHGDQIPERERKEGILCWVLGTTSHLSKAGFALGFEQGCSFGVSFSMCYLIFFFFW